MIRTAVSRNPVVPEALALAILSNSLSQAPAALLARGSGFRALVWPKRRRGASTGALGVANLGYSEIADGVTGKAGGKFYASTVHKIVGNDLHT